MHTSVRFLLIGVRHVECSLHRGVFATPWSVFYTVECFLHRGVFATPCCSFVCSCTNRTLKKVFTFTNS